VTTVQPGTRHALDPLNAAEIERAAAAVRAAHPDLADPTFSVIVLQEPTRAEALAGAPIARRALVTVFERGAGVGWAGTVDLATGTLVAWASLDGAQPLITDTDYGVAIAACHADERFRAALERRGLDVERVSIAPLSPGFFDGYPEDRRCLWATVYEVLRPGEESFGSPVENVLALVDVSAGEVLQVVDGDVIPVPQETGALDEEAAGGFRELAEIAITQPGGPGFTVDGHEIAWQNWRFHAALHPVEGLVLHDVRYVDGGEERSILHRAGLSEMVVPYGDPGPGFFWRSYFDAGEYGIGKLSNSLELGCDCLGEIRYIDAVVNDDDGSPRTIANAICLHEEDAGLMWKHTSVVTGRPEVRRARRFIVSSIATIGNYDYAFYWSFHLDGTIELEVRLTGMILAQAVLAEGELRHAHRVTPTLAGPLHQHLFNVRLDMAVDGYANSVYEVDMVAAPEGPDNPYGGALIATETPIERESEGRRAVAPTAGRTGKVVNHGRRNAVGGPTGYKLVPFNGPVLLAHEGSGVARRAEFARHHLWVTRYADDERSAAGPFPNQSRGGEGLPAWTAADRDLRDADVVLWHTFGTSHVVRPEDWPVMPAERIGFQLKPVGFFDRNPALDVPPGAGGGTSCGHAPGCHR
jgi:primary-amine oxidase